MANKEPNLKIHIGGDTSDLEKKVKGLESLLDASSTKIVKMLKAGAVSAVLALGAAFGKVMGDMVTLTQKFGDEWNVAMEGLRGAYQAFVRGLANGDGFRELFENVARARQVAREAAAEMDELFERGNSANYQESIVKNQIAYLNQYMRDQSLSDEDRKAAAEKLIALEKQLGDMKSNIAQQEADAARKRLMAQTGLTNSEIDYLVRDYERNRDMIQKAAEYLDAKNKASRTVSSANSFRGVGGGINYVADNAALQQLESNTSSGVKAVAEMLTKYNLANDELVSSLVEADNKVINLSTDAVNATTRANSLLGSLNNRGVSGGALDAELASIARIDERLKDSTTKRSEQYETEKALYEKFGKDITALTEEYVNDLLSTIQSAEDGTRELFQAISEIPSVKLDLSEDKSWQAPANQFFDNLAQQERQAEMLAMRFRDVVVEGFSGGIQEITDQLFGLSETNPGAIFQALLSPLADMAISEGEILVASGIGVEAIKEALESLNGAAAIAAGAALIAVGAAAKSALGALASSRSTYSASSYTASSGAGSAAASGELYNRDVNVRVQGTLEASGSTLVAVLNNENNRKNHTT